MACADKVVYSWRDQEISLRTLNSKALSFEKLEGVECWNSTRHTWNPDFSMSLYEKGRLSCLSEIHANKDQNITRQASRCWATISVACLQCPEWATRQFDFLLVVFVGTGNSIISLKKNKSKDKFWFWHQFSNFLKLISQLNASLGQEPSQTDLLTPFQDAILSIYWNRLSETLDILWCFSSTTLSSEFITSHGPIF